MVIIFAFFYLDGEKLYTGAEVSLKKEDLRHAYKVLRIKDNELISISDGLGNVYSAIVKESMPDGIVASLNERISCPKSNFQITLIQSLVKGDKMDMIIRQSVEIGVDHIIPVVTKRTVPVLDRQQVSKKMERWRTIMRSASAQSRRAFLPSIENPLKLKDIPGLIQDKEVFIPWEEEKGISLQSELSKPCPANRAVFLFIGPEGGFSPDEINILLAAGSKIVHIGPRILRTETAAIVALALIQSAWGDLSNEGALT